MPTKRITRSHTRLRERVEPLEYVDEVEECERKTKRTRKVSRKDSVASAKSDCQAPQNHHAPDYHEFSSEEVEAIRSGLVGWYHENKRTLEWRVEWEEVSFKQKDQLSQRAYEVWVSEIMLQQTQVKTVREYYRRWIARWPTVRDLAKADLEDVNKVWAGLGYYQRARRLHEGAKKVVNDLGGVMPSNAADLQRLIPGIGRYTAGAIASIAYNQPAELVDGNVVRVLTRLRAIGGDPKSNGVIAMIWDLAKTLIHPVSPGDFNQALMELGATVCTPTNPSCKVCPIQSSCRALEEVSFTKLQRAVVAKMPDIEGCKCTVCIPRSSSDPYRVTDYPCKVEKKPPREEGCVVCILEHTSDTSQIHYLLQKRPEKGLLAGLWEFPNVSITKAHLSSQEYIRMAGEEVQERLGITLPEESQREYIGSIIHLFSHIRQTYEVVRISFDR
ncbi:DNA glycosylase [Basidiobolus meristosporus CBS 931.73]|uniref:Adenine DNA glycosylase n=1 Tax=Basidiobolus meristosporus CBS 931.73 TaxID=1314790 RepID=A0A1Y1XRR9_9FUNG|nr:DNA glycosylase [Basidiobolus meristosporus CBS 931.73]|eukprot:ORX88427.1 DNA glycosylase [Basidiobolus meristosporus CBS 931.73]